MYLRTGPENRQTYRQTYRNTSASRCYRAAGCPLPVMPHPARSGGFSRPPRRATVVLAGQSRQPEDGNHAGVRPTYQNHDDTGVSTAMPKTARTMIVGLVMGIAAAGIAGGAVTTAAVPATAPHPAPHPAVLRADAQSGPGPAADGQPGDMTWG